MFLSPERRKWISIYWRFAAAVGSTVGTKYQFLTAVAQFIINTRSEYKIWIKGGIEHKIEEISIVMLINYVFEVELRLILAYTTFLELAHLQSWVTGRHCTDSFSN
jgi:hypothetical protein